MKKWAFLHNNGPVSSIIMPDASAESGQVPTEAAHPVAGYCIDFYVETFLSEPLAADSHPTVLKFKLTGDVLTFVKRMSRAVCDLQAMQIKTGKMPMIECIVTNDEADSCGLWTVMVDDEAFHFVPDEGPTGLISASIFIEELEDLLADRGEPTLYSRIGGAIILRSGLTPEAEMHRRVEASFPEMAAARVGQQMSTTIQAALADTSLNPPASAARPRNRAL